MSDTYTDFLRSKIQTAPVSGFEVEPDMLSPALKPHQRDALIWALRGGRRVLEGAIKYHDLFHDALMLKPEADYLRAKLDERLRKIIPPEAFAPFEERYPKIEPERYEKK